MTSPNFGPATGQGQVPNLQTQNQIANMIVATAYARTTLDNITRSILGGHDFMTGAAARSYPRFGKIVAAAMTEGNDGTATSLSATKVTLTPAECGLGVDLTDSALAGLTPQDITSYVAALMGRGYADFVDTQGLAQASSAGSTVGTTNTAITLDVLLSAINKLEVNDADSPFAAIFGATPVHTLRTLTGGTSGSTNPVFMREDVLSRIGPSLPNGEPQEIPAGLLNNYAMTIYGVDIFKSTNVPTANTAVDVLSIMFPILPMMFPFKRLIMEIPQGLGWAPPGGGAPLMDNPAAGAGPWDARFEFQRDASGRLSELWVTGSWAWGVVATNWLAAILTKA